MDNEKKEDISADIMNLKPAGFLETYDSNELKMSDAPERPARMMRMSEDAFLFRPRSVAMKG